MAFDHDALEWTHDYIQWLFPLDLPSSVQPWAPVVDRQCQEKFRADPKSGDALRCSLERMLEFYGLRIVEQNDEVTIERGNNFDERSAVWLTRGNHNFLRLTRIMTSLSLLGQKKLAVALQRCLDDVYREFGRTIGETTRAYWTSAVS